MPASLHNNQVSVRPSLRDPEQSPRGVPVVDACAAVTIVTPAHNASRFLPDAVASIQSQTFSDWELIIVNDGSSDDTASVAEDLAIADSRIRVYHQRKSGVSSARNLGLSVAVSPYVAFLDADDLWTPAALERLIGELESHPEYPAVYGVSGYVDDGGNSISGATLESWVRRRLRVEGRRRREVPIDQPTSFEMLAVRNYIAIGAIVLRREYLEKLGGFHADLSGMEDWHLWLRLSRIAPIGFVDELVLNYRRHDRNVTRNAKKMSQQQFCAALDLFDTLELNRQERQLFLRSQPIVCHLYWARDHFKRGRVRAAAGHIALAGRNLIDFHVAPKLTRD